MKLRALDLQRKFFGPEILRDVPRNSGAYLCFIRSRELPTTGVFRQRSRFQILGRRFKPSGGNENAGSLLFYARVNCSHRRALSIQQTSLEAQGLL